MELAQLESLMQMAVKYGIVKLEFQNVKLEFSTTGATLPQEFNKDNYILASNSTNYEVDSLSKITASASITPQNVELGQEDLLFWSVEQPTESNLPESQEKVA